MDPALPNESPTASDFSRMYTRLVLVTQFISQPATSWFTSYCTVHKYSLRTGRAEGTGIPRLGLDLSIT
jgi:hypothetical protein